MKSRSTLGHCKDCGNAFHLANTARRMDVARGLSEPERCPDCRKRRRQEIKSKGAIFQEPPKETDDSKRCWGKFGLAYIVRKPLGRTPIPDGSVPVDLPLQWADAPHMIAESRNASIAEKFSRIAPAAEALVRNLEDPNGTRFSVLHGPTGTGKSTWVPYRILKSAIGEQGRICVTQPRLVTLKQPKNTDETQEARQDELRKDTTIPGFIARELLRASGVGAGHEVGYQYGGESGQQDRYTKLLYVTDGMLLNWLKDGRVGQFDVVFVDEAHEQSSNMEQIFALLKYRLPLYPRMRVVIASATADVEKFRNYFGDGNPEAVFLAEPDEDTASTPYEIYDRPLEDFVSQLPGVDGLSNLSSPKDMQRRLPEIVPQLVEAIRDKPGFTKLNQPKGDLLVFVPTMGSVTAVAEALRKVVNHPTSKATDLDVVVSHAKANDVELKRFKQSEQRAQKAAARGVATKPQRIIVATNYAETSVTMANVRYVIDSGLIMLPEWDPHTCSFSFNTHWHSKAGCKQRKGRVGRTNSGEYFRLYPSDVYETFPDQTPPELTRQPLDEFLLSAKSAGIEHLDSFQWMSRTAESSDLDDSEFDRSLASLSKRGALDKDGDITDRGLELGAFHTPRVELADCLALANRFACAVEVATFLAFAEQSRSPFARGDDELFHYSRWRSGCYDDVEFSLRLFFHWWKNPGDKQRDQWARREHLVPEFFQDVQKQRDRTLGSLQRRDDKKGERTLDLRRLNRVRLILARSLSEWTYVAEEGNFATYVPHSDACPSQMPVRIDRDSACVAKSDLKAFVCLKRVKKGDMLFAQQIIQIDPEWLPGLQGLGPLGM